MSTTMISTAKPAAQPCLLEESQGWAKHGLNAADYDGIIEGRREFVQS